MFTRKKIAVAVAMSGMVGLLGCGESSMETAAKQNVVAPLASGVSNQDIYSDYLNRDVRDDIFYFVLPDRFENGDPSNDSGLASIPESYGGLKIDDKGYYHGGDLAGLTQRLDYLQEMGITAVWLTPVLRNQAAKYDGSGYHGYWILDFTQIDPHLGTNAELNKLIDAAHARGMKVFFDIIVNHTADVIRYRECHLANGDFRSEADGHCEFKAYDQVTSGDSYTPFVPAGLEAIKTPAWLNDPKYYNNRGDSKWSAESVINGDFVGLDDLNTAMPEVVEGMIDIYKDILSEFKPDGFRIDTVKHVEMSFWEDFSPAIMAHAQQLGIPNFQIFGEIAQGDAAFLSRYTTLGKIPAALDFAFYYAINDVVAKGQSIGRLQSVFADDDYYADADSDADLKFTFVSNHDNGRMGMWINKGLPQASDSEKVKRVTLGHAAMYFGVGIPVVYYGDEQGFNGDGGDKDARNDMMSSKVASYLDNDLFGTDVNSAVSNFDTGHPIYQSLQQFGSLYKQHRALRRGIQIPRVVEGSGSVIAFSRVDRAEQVDHLVLLNTSSNPQTFKVGVPVDEYRYLYGGEANLTASEGQLSITVPALETLILRASQVLPKASVSGILLRSSAIDSRSPAFVDLQFDVEKTGEGTVSLRVELVMADGSKQLVAEDHEAPYRIKLQRSWLSDDQGTVQVSATNAQGDVLQQEFVVDAR